MNGSANRSPRADPKDRQRIEQVGTAIVDSAIHVHRVLGQGLLESAYQACFGYHLKRLGLDVRTEVHVPVVYEGLKVDVGYRIDMLVEESVVVENKAVERLLPVHASQILTYLGLGGYRLGYLLIWNVRLMKFGINRFVLGL